jgi:hypothetical protein
MNGERGGGSNRALVYGRHSRYRHRAGVFGPEVEEVGRRW